MEEWRNVDLSKEEEEAIVVEEEEERPDEIFSRSLVGTLWTDNPFNVRAFKQVTVQAWRLKHTVEVQELNKNLFLFRFSSKRDVETVLKTGPWSFDKNLIILKRITGEEQPSEMELHTGEFWFRVYELPLKLRSDAMAKKLGDSVGAFVEVDGRDGSRLGKSFRVKAMLDLRQPLKRGTIIKYQGKNLRVFFKYERLPNLCFGCGRLGHQWKDCEEVEVLEGKEYEDMDEQEQPYGLWLKASPQSKFYEENNKGKNSSSCSRSLFSEASASKPTSMEKKRKSGVEDQAVIEGNLGKQTREGEKSKDKSTRDDVESVVEYSGNVEITKPEPKTSEKKSNKKKTSSSKPVKMWARKKGRKVDKKQEQLIVELGKRSLIDVMVSEGDPMEVCNMEKKRRNEEAEGESQEPEVVLESQHRLPQ